MRKKEKEREILLVNTNQMKPPVGPVAIDYLSGSLEAQGFDVHFLDFCFSTSWKNDLDLYLDHHTPLAIGLSVRNTDDCYYPSQDFIIPRIGEMVDYIKQRATCPIILGGVGFSVMPERTLQWLDLDFGIWGDGEWALSEFVLRLKDGRDPSSVPGLIFRKGDEFRRNPPDLRSILDLPLAKRNAVDNPRYLREGAMVGIETKRGCNQKCIYCADPIAKGRKSRLRPPETVVDEIEALLAKGVDYFHTCDSEFNIPYSHAVDVCREIIGRGLGERLKWYTYLSPVPFTGELAHLMIKAGCKGIDFGADHVDDRMLKNLGRPFRARDLKKTAATCNEFEIPFMYDLLLGGPGEDRESLKRAIELMKEIGPTRVGISAGIRVYPGTRLAEIVKEEGIDEQNPNLHGTISPDLFAPLFYVSNLLGNEITTAIISLIAGDERFFFGGKDEDPANYNYNENSILMNAIKDGYRGAFWDILRKLADGAPPDCPANE